MKKRIHIVDLALMDNEGTGNPYPTSPHEWMSVKELEERDAEIEELASKYEVLLLRANDVAAENHRLTERVAELEAESTAFLSFVIGKINAIIGGDHNDMINDLCRLRNYLEGEAE